MSSPSNVVVVLEDAHHRMLIYRYLINHGFNSHAVRIELSPSGAGSAESWVRARFVKEVSMHRSRRARTASALIVVVDADSYTVHQRLAQLDQALGDSGKQTVQDNEQIARLIPKRNVETWILCLNQREVNEETDYKRTRHDWRSLIPPAADALSDWSRNVALPDHCVDSLRDGIRELRSLEF